MRAHNIFCLYNTIHHTTAFRTLTRICDRNILLWVQGAPSLNTSYLSISNTTAPTRPHHLPISLPFHWPSFLSFLSLGSYSCITASALKKPLTPFPPSYSLAKPQSWFNPGRLSGPGQLKASGEDTQAWWRVSFSWLATKLTGSSVPRVNPHVSLFHRFP